MKIQSSVSDIPKQITVVNVKTVQIKKGFTINDLIEIKNKKLTLKKAVLVGEKLFVDDA